MRRILRVLPDLIVILVLFLLWLRPGRDFRSMSRGKRSRIFVSALIFIYLSAVAVITFSPVIVNLPGIFRRIGFSMNLFPFFDLIHGYGDYWRQIILNVVMFLPFGFLLPLKHPKLGFWGVLALGLFVSLSIELMQPVLNPARSSDITDVITNTSGAVIGYLLYLVHKAMAKMK